MQEVKLRAPNALETLRGKQMTPVVLKKLTIPDIQGLMVTEFNLSATPKGTKNKLITIFLECALQHNWKPPERARAEDDDGSGDGFHEEAGDAAPAAGAVATVVPVGILIGQEVFAKFPSEENEFDDEDDSEVTHQLYKGHITSKLGKGRNALCHVMHEDGDKDDDSFDEIQEVLPWDYELPAGYRP